MRNVLKKMVRVGYALFVKRDKSGAYQRVESLFGSKHKAEEMARTKYPSLKFRVEGVKLDHSPYATVGGGRGGAFGQGDARKQGGPQNERGDHG